MRVALVSAGLPLGGSTTYMLFLASALRELGAAAEVFSFTRSHPLADQFTAAGVQVHTCDDARYIYEDRLQQVYAAVKRFGADAVIAVLGAESFELLRHLPAGVGRLGIFHDRAIRPEIFAPRYQSVIDHLITGSGYLVPEVKQVAPGLSCTGVPYGIPINPSWQPRDPNPTEPLRLIYYGRLENASKGVRIFPEIAAALNRRSIPFRWTIHGTGPEEEFLHTALAAEEQAGRVLFSKPIPHDQLPGLVRAHDVYLLTSTNEGGPQTLLESMAMGLVPVCGDIPCLVQDVIRPSNGFRVPRDQPDAYAEAIGQLHADRARLEQLSHAAREAITRDNSSRRMAEQYLEIIRGVMAKKAPAVWPERIRPLPILGAPAWSFSLPARMARRLRRQLARGKP